MPRFSLFLDPLPLPCRPLLHPPPPRTCMAPATHPHALLMGSFGRLSRRICLAIACLEPSNHDTAFREAPTLTLCFTHAHAHPPSFLHLLLMFHLNPPAQPWPSPYMLCSPSYSRLNSHRYSQNLDHVEAYNLNLILVLCACRVCIMLMLAFPQAVRCQTQHAFFICCVARPRAPGHHGHLSRQFALAIIVRTSHLVCRIFRRFSSTTVWTGE